MAPQTASGVTTRIIHTPAHLTATTDLAGSLAACSSALDRGMDGDAMATDSAAAMVSAAVMDTAAGMDTQAVVTRVVDIAAMPAAHADMQVVALADMQVAASLMDTAAAHPVALAVAAAASMVEAVVVASTVAVVVDAGNSA